MTRWNLCHPYQGDDMPKKSMEEASELEPVTTLEQGILERLERLRHVYRASGKINKSARILALIERFHLLTGGEWD